MGLQNHVATAKLALYEVLARMLFSSDDAYESLPAHRLTLSGNDLELSVAAWLNDRGWSLEDVSAQNLGYDLAGVDESGCKVQVEVKKVDRPDARFSMTNNEISLMRSSPQTYLLAIVIGDESHARLMMIAPNQHELATERVCRRWDWEFSRWSHAGTYVD